MPEITATNPDGAGVKGWWEKSPKKLTKLEEGFKNGLNDKEACQYAGITERQLYYYEQTHEDFDSRKQLLKENVKAVAKLNVADAIKNKDVEVSQWYLERKAKDEFSPRTELTELGVQYVITREDDKEDDKKTEPISGATPALAEGSPESLGSIPLQDIINRQEGAENNV